MHNFELCQICKILENLNPNKENEKKYIVNLKIWRLDSPKSFELNRNGPENKMWFADTLYNKS